MPQDWFSVEVFGRVVDEMHNDNDVTRRTFFGFATKTRAQAEKYFWKNAARIYKYVKRANSQPSPISG